MTKRVNPYTRLKEIGQQFALDVKYRHSVGMFHFNRSNLKDSTSWSLDDVYERALAAETLGFEVILHADNEGMSINYRKKPPLTPHEFKY